MKNSVPNIFNSLLVHAAAAAKSLQPWSDTVQPHRWQPTRLLRPWDSPGKNTGVGCHFLLQCMKVKSKSEVTQLCLTLSDPMDHSLPGSSVHGISQARELEWGATAFSTASAYPPINQDKKNMWNRKNVLKTKNLDYYSLLLLGEK